MKKNINGTEAIIWEADQYIQVNDVCNADLGMIVEQLKLNYKTFDKWFCYHNNETPSALINEFGAVLEDDCIEMKLTAENFINFDASSVMRITDKNFHKFASYHDERNPEMYWTSERIRRDLSLWGIFAMITKGSITGYILHSMHDAVQSEIFYIEEPDNAKCQSLFLAAAQFAFDNGKKEVLYMAEENSISKEAALSVGFVVTGFYKGYVIRRTN